MADSELKEVVEALRGLKDSGLSLDLQALLAVAVAATKTKAKCKNVNQNGVANNSNAD